MAQVKLVDDNNNIWKLDPVTGSCGYIGNAGVTGILDIAEYAGAMYGIGSDLFYSINPDSAAGTLVSDLGGLSGNSLACSQNGTLYTVVAGNNLTDAHLATINPTTAAVTLIGPLGIGAGTGGDLAFDSNDRLFAVTNEPLGGNNLATLDVTTGAATLVGSIGFSAVYGLEFTCCGLIAGTYNFELLQINAWTGSGTQTGTTDRRVYGLSRNAWSNCCC